MRKQHLAILSDNKPGVLTHIAGLISRKAINIESLTVGYTERTGCVALQYRHQHRRR